MVAKPHRQNSDFQLRYFLAGDCKTPDGAWALMYGQRIDMESKLRHSEAQRLNREAIVCKANAKLKWLRFLPWVKLKAQADILEALADVETWQNNLDAAHQELASIQKIMDELEPHRKYSHLPMLEANEAAQSDEWLGELKTRAENYIMTQGTIPHDHLNTMRCHPEFKTELVPYIADTYAKVTDQSSIKDKLLSLEQPEVLALT